MSTHTSLQILFENENFIAVNKPSGWLVVPGRQGILDSRPCVGVELQNLLAPNLVEKKIYPIHRLDFEVSGLVLFAKNAKSHHLANQWFEKREIHKIYEAITEGNISSTILNTTLEWSSLLLRGKKRAYESPQGKPSITRALCKGKANGNNEGLLIWQIEPLTGRSHQIRYELAKHGYPICGDILYGSKVPPIALNRIELKAVILDFSNCTEARLLGLPSQIGVLP